MFSLARKKLLGICGAITGIGLSATYFYQKHMYEKELFNRMNYLLQNPINLSGVYLQQRQPFSWLWYIRWILPYHQSLKIVHKDGSVRHVGLAGVPGNGFSMQTEFTLHEGGNYKKLNDYDLSFPIECWVDYKRKFGHFPENINVDELNKITMTRKEAKTSEDLDKIYRVTFGKPTRDYNGDFVFTSCRSAVMYAIREEEIRRTAKKE